MHIILFVYKNRFLITFLIMKYLLCKHWHWNQYILALSLMLSSLLIISSHYMIDLYFEFVCSFVSKSLTSDVKWRFLFSKTNDACFVLFSFTFFNRLIAYQILTEKLNLISPPWSSIFTTRHKVQSLMQS